ncbi:MAG: DNA mismatch repair endonuclease MutL [Shewanella sp.]
MEKSMGIQILPPQLANQIAAGEVVERPASVVKELVENSLDAGATRVDIEIDRGGSKLIKIRDNGSGIPKEELALALSRHATSKLHSLDDLEAILSFGFRGEALASISSVSRLTLTSRTAAQTEAWQAYAEGADMAVKVNPAAHPVGSTIEVVDLFFNTPARRRFLKSDKTEFTHIDEWLKRIALVRGDIHFTLSHNGKIVRNYRPAISEAQYLQRLTQVAGRAFAEQALKVECAHDDLRLRGYLQSPWSSVLTDTHYFYVNGRLIRDRLVNHAVRQAFAQKAEIEQPGYVLMLDIDPHQVDVNVHPAKHEVRFHQSRYVHDYILQALQSALEEASSLCLGLGDDEPDNHAASDYHRAQSVVVGNAEVGNGVVESAGEAPTGSDSDDCHDGLPGDDARGLHTNYASNGADGTYQPASAGASLASPRAVQVNQFGRMQAPKASLARDSSAGRQGAALPCNAAIASYAALLQTPSYRIDESAHPSPEPAMPLILDNQYWLMVEGDKLSLLPINAVALATRLSEITAKIETGLIGQPLLMPVSVAADPDWQLLLDEHSTLLRQLGLELTIRYQQLIIKKVPPYLRECQLATVIPEWLQSLRFAAPAPNAVAMWLAKHSLSGFMSAPTVWSAFSQLTQENRAQIAKQAILLPWQSWLEEQASE